MLTEQKVLMCEVIISVTHFLPQIPFLLHLTRTIMLNKSEAIFSYQMIFLVSIRPIINLIFTFDTFIKYNNSRIIMDSIIYI